MDNIKDFETFVNEGIFTNGIHRKNLGKEKKEDSLEVKLREFCERHNDERKYKNFTIKPGNIVDCSTAVSIYNDDLVNGKLPFMFGEVKGFFSCSLCSDLESLEGCPKVVHGNFGCNVCFSLESLEGCPKEVHGNFYCRDCGCNFTKEEVKQHCNVKGDIHV